MNCATHNDLAAVAFCRTCGKALCGNCTRDVRGVIYCEACLAARMEGTAPAAAFAPAPGIVPLSAGSAGPRANRPPSPGLAAALGLIPGVGAMYNGQFVKGMIHVVAFVFLIALAAHIGPITVPLFFAYFFYLIFDAYKTAHAIELGAPPPDPFGITQTFGGGEKASAHNVPVAAAVLIGLGILFLLHTMDLFEFNFDWVWPSFLILLGFWLFARRRSSTGTAQAGCVCNRCQTRYLMWPAILVTVGVLWLLDNTTRFGWDRTWPVMLLIVGVVKLLQNNASSEGHIGPLPPAPPSAPPPQAPPSEPSQEVRNV